MEEIEIGSEKRLFEFMKNLDGKDKIALVSHTDLDGIVCAKVVNKVFSVDLVKFVNYHELNSDLIKELKEKKVNKIIITDLFIKKADFVEELDKFSEVLIIDHHSTIQDWNSKKIFFIKGVGGYSAGYLCYNLFRKIKEIENLDWLVACSCISDYCHKNPVAWLKKTFEKYGDKFEFDGDYVRKSGKFWELQWTISLALIYFENNLQGVYDSISDEFGEIDSLGKYAKEVENEVKKVVDRFEKEKVNIKDGYYFEYKPKFSIGSIDSNVISGKYHHKTIIIVRPRNGFYSVSMRRQDGGLDTNKFLSELLRGFDGADGGGHFKASGGNFPKKYLAEFRKRVGVKEKP